MCTREITCKRPLTSSQLLGWQYWFMKILNILRPTLGCIVMILDILRSYYSSTSFTSVFYASCLPAFASTGSIIFCWSTSVVWEKFSPGVSFATRCCSKKFCSILRMWHASDTWRIKVNFSIWKKHSWDALDVACWMVVCPAFVCQACHCKSGSMGKQTSSTSLLLRCLRKHGVDRNLAASANLGHSPTEYRLISASLIKPLRFSGVVWCCMNVDSWCDDVDWSFHNTTGWKWLGRCLCQKGHRWYGMLRFLGRHR